MKLLHACHGNTKILYSLDCVPKVRANNFANLSLFRVQLRVNITVPDPSKRRSLILPFVTSNSREY